MIIPNNGKVVIFDDKIQEVSLLMKALSSNNVPFSYFQDENGDDLPNDENPIKNIRLVFLDIELETGVRHGSRSVISIPLSRLDKIILKNNGPYFLFIWSTKYEEYGELFITEVNTSDIFENRRPIKIITLNKKDFLSKDIFGLITEELEKEITAFDSLNAFFYWESIINDSAGEITNELISLIKRDGDWNQDTKNILYKLSSAYWGLSLKDFKPEEDKKKMFGAYSTLNQVLSDKIDYNANNSYNPILNNILEPKGERNIELFAKINEKIHVDNNPQTDLTIPGSTIFCIENMHKEIEILNIKFASKIIGIKTQHEKKPFLDVEDRIKNVQNCEKQAIDSVKRIIGEKQIVLKSIIAESLINPRDFDPELRGEIITNSHYIEVNISPRCDFAQNKLKNVRFLPGVLILEKYLEHLNKNADYNYLSDFKVHLEGNHYLFLFDFRFFYSIKNGSSKCCPKFRIKENFLNELQVKLSGHISRLGLLYMS